MSVELYQAISETNINKVKALLSNKEVSEQINDYFKNDMNAIGVAIQTAVVLFRKQLRTLSAKDKADYQAAQEIIKTIANDNNFKFEMPVTNRGNELAIAYCLEEGFYEGFELLKNNKTGLLNINAKNINNNNTVLHWAIKRSDKDAVIQTLALGADPLQKTTHPIRDIEVSPLELAQQIQNRKKTAVTNEISNIIEKSISDKVVVNAKESASAKNAVTTGNNNDITKHSKDTLSKTFLPAASIKPKPPENLPNNQNKLNTTHNLTRK